MALIPALQIVSFCVCACVRRSPAIHFKKKNRFLVNSRKTRAILLDLKMYLAPPDEHLKRSHVNHHL